jgi:hypothetical protein
MLVLETSRGSRIVLISAVQCGHQLNSKTTSRGSPDGWGRFVKYVNIKMGETGTSQAGSIAPRKLPYSTSACLLFLFFLPRPERLRCRFPLVMIVPEPAP